MSLYKNNQTGEIRDISDDVYSSWISASNPKAAAWESYEYPVIEPSPPTDQEIWEEKLAGVITVGGIDLKASINSRDTFTGQFTLLSAARQMGYIQGDSIQSIWDANNVEHKFTTDQLLGILLSYGFEWQKMFADYAP
jgi:hypothetical protein